MKKINSNSYGGKIIGLGLIPLALIPEIFWGINRFLNLKILSVLIAVSVGIGILIEVSFFIILMVELWQDKKIQEYYEANPGSEKTPQDILDGK